MSRDDGEWIEYFRDNGVLLGVYRERDAAWLVVADELFEHYRLRLGQRDEDGEVWVGIDARHSDDREVLANYTPSYEGSGPPLMPADVTIADDGFLSVMGRVRHCASGVDIRKGFTVKLPVAFVVPVRKALAMLQTPKVNWPQQVGAACDGP